jgi:hypothetical protein
MKEVTDLLNPYCYKDSATLGNNFSHHLKEKLLSYFHESQISEEKPQIALTFSLQTT